MSNLFRLNLFFVGIPIILGLLGYFFDEALIYWALISTILTGLVQLIIGFGMYFDEPKDKLLRWYVILVVFFFSSWILSGLLKDSFDIMKFLIFLPPFLAFYLTFIIYKKRNQ